MSKQVALYYNDIFLAHDTRAGHPESPARLKAIMSSLREHEISKHLQIITSFTSFAQQVLPLIHTSGYIESVRKRISSGERFLDSGDTTVCESSLEAAYEAVNATVTACDNVWKGVHDAAFCAVRPPGHHAESGRAMGFCIFNNIAAGAAHLLEKGAQRIAIVDFDVHHGNGTQKTFENEDRVLFISLHQYPHYPGSGSGDEDGVGKGKAYTVNFPMYPGFGDAEYLMEFDTQVIPLVKKFDPQIILISAGFDAHESDPLADMNVTTGVYRILTQRLTAIANETAKGKVVSILEGGYNLLALADSVIAHLQGLIDEDM